MNDNSVFRILIVDDTPKNIQVLGAILKKENYQLNVAQNGLQALDSVKKVLPDLILLDVMMPELDGYETCKRLKASQETKDIPVIFLTAKVDVDDIVKGFEAGAVDYVSKPFNQTELLKRVRLHLELKHSREVLKEQFEQLQKLEVMRESLTKMLVHDLRTPLTSIKGFTDLLSLTKVFDQDESASSFVRSINLSTGILLDMVTAILDVAKFEADEMKLDKSMVNITEVLTDIEVGLDSLLNKKSINFNIDINSEAAEVNADPDLLRRIFVNIIGNSINFSPKKGKISIYVTPEAGKIRISIKDEGPGIPEGYREKIFEKFGQVESRHTGLKYSTGLGLAFCKMAVEAHGGTIGVESEVGKGSTFWFVLPV
ncbi:response regulator [candidate division KSB1 bacterium]